MPHSIDQPRVIKRLTVKNLVQIGADFILIVPVMNVLLDVLKHLQNLQVCTAVLRSLQGAQGSRHRGIAVRSCRRYHMRRKGRVVAAAVLGMQNQCRIEYLCLQLCILTVRMQHLKQIFSERKLRLRVPDDKVLPQMIMSVRVVAVHGQKRHLRDHG